MRFLSVLLLLSSLLFSVSPKITTTMSMQELNKLTASDGAIGDWFGNSVAMSGDTVVVGAYGDGYSDKNFGSAYLYERDTATGLFHQTAKLTESDGFPSSFFGKSVAISGDSVVVGSNSGVYIYEKPGTGWADSDQETAKLTVSGSFAKSVAISGDSVVVGSSSIVHIYEKPGTGWADTDQETAKLTAPDAVAKSTFGFSVAMSDDSVVVGAWKGDDASGVLTGSAYLYEKPDTGWADTNQETAKLTASDGALFDNFGGSVAISGDSVVVGAKRRASASDGPGSAYLYEKPSTGWADSNQTAKLTASDGAAGDFFGWSVAISGDTIVVGALLNDDSGSDSGSAYLYEKPDTGWADSNQETAKLTASDGAAYDWFGGSVAISGDSVVVGAAYDGDYGDDPGGDSGSAYIFKNAIFQNSIENKKDIIDIEASDADNDTITFSVLGGSDASFFDIDASTGLLSFKVAPDFENPQDANANNTYEASIRLTDTFRESNTYAVFIRVSDVDYEGSMPKAINFKELNKLTDSNGKADSNFGYSTAISSSTLVVGAYGYNGNRGRVYIYEYNALSDHFEEVAQLKASDGVADDYFGISVAISGETIVVGAIGDDCHFGQTESGSAYIYQKPSTGWANVTQTAKLRAFDRAHYDFFGWSVAISGDTIVIGAFHDDDSGRDSGSAYIYENPSFGWIQTAKLTASDGAAYDWFGCSVAMSGDSVVVGAYGNDDSGSDSGSAYFYEKPSTGWADTNQETAKLTASDGAAEDLFGISVAISGDSVVVGAYLNDDSGSDSGSAYLYEKPGTGWADTNQETAKLTASDGAAEDRFGRSIAISGETIVVGAYLNDDSGSDSGSAYIYEKPHTGWANAIQSAKLTASDGAAEDFFGWSVAISGDTIVAGAYGDDTDTLGDKSGSAYIFKAK